MPRGIRPLTPNQITEEVQNFVNLCFSRMDQLSFAQLAELSGLSLPTVYNLWHGKVSHCTHTGTIMRLGRVAGLSLTFTKYRAKLRLVG